MKNRTILKLSLATVVILAVLKLARSPKGHQNSERESPVHVAAPEDPALDPTARPLSAPPAVSAEAPSTNSRANPTPPSHTVGDGRPQALLGPDEEARAKFNALTKEAWNTIPTKAQLQKLTSEQAHYTPKELLAAGDQIGRVAEALRTDPGLAEEGMRFFGACATEASFANSVRALCVHQLERQLAAKGRTLGTFPGIEKVPEAVRELAEKLAEKNY